MLKKISLAAVIAMTGVSFASATPLTEAIKNVDFGGYLRLRAYYDSDTGKAGSKALWRTTALLKFSVPVSEELKFNTAYAFDWAIDSAGTPWNEVTNTGTGAAPAYGNVKFFLQYSKDGVTALVGKIPVPTPVTATGVGEATAAGAILVYKVNPNITLVGAGLDAIVGIDGAALKFDPNKTGSNIGAAAVVYAQDNLKAEAWYFYVKNAIDSDIVLRANYKMDNISLHADFATAELDDKNVAGSLNVTNIPAGFKPNKTQTYFNVSAKYAMDNMCAKIGYAVTGKDGGVVSLDHDSPLNHVTATEQFYGITNVADSSMVYGKFGYKVDPKTNVIAGATFASDTNSNKVQDFTLGVKYQYTKKMNIYAYYDILNADSGNVFKKSDNNEARVEFKYSF